jgi:hypothetical protein
MIYYRTAIHPADSGKKIASNEMKAATPSLRFATE